MLAGILQRALGRLVELARTAAGGRSRAPTAGTTSTCRSPPGPPRASGSRSRSSTSTSCTSPRARTASRSPARQWARGSVIWVAPATVSVVGAVPAGTSARTTPASHSRSRGMVRMSSVDLPAPAAPTSSTTRARSDGRSTPRARAARTMPSTSARVSMPTACPSSITTVASRPCSSAFTASSASSSGAAVWTDSGPSSTSGPSSVAIHNPASRSPSISGRCRTRAVSTSRARSSGEASWFTVSGRRVMMSRSLMPHLRGRAPAAPGTARGRPGRRRSCPAASAARCRGGNPRR